MPLHFALEARSVAPNGSSSSACGTSTQARRRTIRELGVAAYTMADIDRLGMARVIAEALAIAGDGAGSLHLSFDMDAIDPREAPGVGTPVAADSPTAKRTVDGSGRGVGGARIARDHRDQPDSRPPESNRDPGRRIGVERAGKDDAMSFDPVAFEHRRRTFEDVGRFTCPACGYRRSANVRPTRSVPCARGKTTPGRQPRTVRRATTSTSRQTTSPADRPRLLADGGARKFRRQLHVVPAGRHRLPRTSARRPRSNARSSTPTSARSAD